MENFEATIQSEIDNGGLLDFKMAIENKSIASREAQEAVTNMQSAINAGITASVFGKSTENNPSVESIARNIFK